MSSLAFLQGFYAYWEYKVVEDNPYPSIPSTQDVMLQHEEWREGFAQASESHFEVINFMQGR